jgi:hypothetical protein
MSTSWIGDRKPDRYVPGFGGRMNAIYSPVGTPKPREECQTFTFILHDPSGHRDDSRNHRRFTPEQNIKAQEKFLKQLATLTKKQEREAKARARKAKVNA